MGQAPRGSAIKNDLPGPGQYNYNDGPRGGVSFGKETRDGKHTGTDLPGPGQYNSPQDKGKGISFGVRHSLNKPELGPGPGAYDSKVDPLHEHAPAFSMGGRPKGKDGAEIPGPGNYNPDINAVK